MAKNDIIKGITIEIGGDVSPLNKALASVNDESKSIQSQLRAVNELLKFDPSNTEAIAEKQRLLAEAAETSRKKLDILRQAQSEVEAQFKAGTMGEAEYKDAGAFFSDFRTSRTVESEEDLTDIYFK